MTDPDLGAWSYAYDNAGNLTRQTDAKNQTTCFYYDPINRLKGKNYQTNTSCPADPGTYTGASYTYDAGTYGKGRRTGMSVPNVDTTSWVYDKQGRVIIQTNTITGAPATYTTGWTYDAMSRPITMTYPIDNEQVATTYDVQGPKSSTYVLGTDYNSAGQLTMLRVASNLATTYTYNPQNMRLTHLTTGNVQDLTYEYYAGGNVKKITDAVRNNEVSNYEYDDLDRLKKAYITGVYTQEWDYSPIGNINYRKDNGVQTNYAYGNPAHKHAVTTVGSTSYTYDNNGNMETRGGSSNRLTYDPENRLTQVISGTVTTNYVYNGDGARVKKTVSGTATYYVGNWYEVTNGVVTKYYYFGAQRVAMKQNGVVKYLHGDHLGSTSVASTDTGAFHSRQTYYAFGVPRTTEGTLPTDYTFTGQK